MIQQLIDAIGYGLCHQLPERTLFGSGLHVPVCARDTGIYLGFLFAAVLILLLDRERPSNPPPAWLNILLAFGVLLMVLDGASSYLGFRPTTNELRLATGIATGFAIAAWVTPMLSSQLWARPGSGRVLGSGSKSGIFLSGMLVTYALVWWALPLLGPGFALLIAFAIIATFTMVNMVLVCLLPSFERRASRLIDVLPAAGIALVLTAVELWASAALKLWMVGAVS